MNGKVLCTICARGGSKGVKNKNIRELSGKPLIAYTIEQAKKSEIFEHIVISTDSDAIATVAKQYGAEVLFMRPAELASDTAGKLPAIQHAFIESEKYYGMQFDAIVDLDATAPIRKVSDIIASYNLLLNGNFGNIITAVPARKSPYFNQVELGKEGRVSLSKIPDIPILRRQDAPKTYDMNASIYIWKKEALLSGVSIINDMTGLYVMDEISMFDVDTEIDFKIIEMIMKEFNA
ncbi:acylneuraminate cytidylyltransferase family protein [Sulfurospirillum arsenophilum]|uniref:acylneuraminate cytidylyltransferase family protein n=1 Tax=Sulfurospirillum arsenophilum TaxID=56698 RepID=UPI0005AA4635|nr:acylneuraminate cytidylyltransferase family protein [Sulfurospirillum arsenophilum]